MLQKLLPTTDFNRDFGEMIHDQYHPLILQPCVPNVVRALMTVKENNSQILQQRPMNIQLSHGKLQTLSLQSNAGIAMKIIVSIHHVYSAIFFRVIVFEGSSLENVAKFLLMLKAIFTNVAGSRRITYLKPQLRTRTYFGLFDMNCIAYFFHFKLFQFVNQYLLESQFSSVFLTMTLTSLSDYIHHLNLFTTALENQLLT